MVVQFQPSSMTISIVLLMLISPMQGWVNEIQRVCCWALVQYWEDVAILGFVDSNVADMELGFNLQRGRTKLEVAKSRRLKVRAKLCSPSSRCSSIIIFGIRVNAEALVKRIVNGRTKEVPSSWTIHKWQTWITCGQQKIWFENRLLTLLSSASVVTDPLAMQIAESHEYINNHESS